jgi:hypothetical protein
MKRGVAFCSVLSLAAFGFGAKLVEVRPVDEGYVMIRWLDSKVVYHDSNKGPRAYGHPEGLGGDVLLTYGDPLDTGAATTAQNYTIVSTDDPAYATGLNPAQCFRKAKVEGTAWKWPDPDYSLEHTVFLKLPRILKQGAKYELQIGSATKSDVLTKPFAFNVFFNVSEAVHTNIVGYNPAHTQMKSADLYMWLGDGGARNYSGFVGRNATLYNVHNGQKTPVGKVSFWKPSGPDCGGWNLTQSNVWRCDFSSFTGTGTYRLAIDGVGCSPNFEIKSDAYLAPYKTSVLGFFFMRIGESKDFSPVPRQPRYIPTVDPPQLKVYMTNFGPWHPEWNPGAGDPWDRRDWSKYKDPGSPTNPNAWGGHSDAADWDRHAGHISIIWDMLLPYILSNGRLGEDNLGIRESGNGIPDLIDEARNEVDFWLRLRDTKGGYAFGLNNPSDDGTTLYQAGARPFMAWANAANCAMLADAFRIAGKNALSKRYKESAEEAWGIAADQDLSYKNGIGNGAVRGTDLKMMAAAYLYNVTGDRKYEDAMRTESVVTGPNSNTEVAESYNQLWGTAAYLMCAKFKTRTIHYPTLLANMKASVIAEARRKNVAPSQTRPSRRSSDDAYGWFQSTEEVQRACVAHAAATRTADKDDLLRALILEADWGLGRNPMNMVQMTGLGSRHARDIYTSGRNDGFPDVHPGHTPYMNANNWGSGFMADPQWMASRGYPEWSQWPHGEALWRARYCYSNNEFTPQQSMRGKMCLLAYLYAIR